MEKRRIRGAFSDQINHSYFVEGVKDLFTSRIDDEAMRERLDADLRRLLEDRKDLFEEGPLCGMMHEGDDDSVEEFLARSVWEAFDGMVLDPPGLFRMTPGDPRMEMLSLMWDVDHFLDTISEWAANADGLLDGLEYLDKTSEAMRLITQNYINMMIKNCMGHTKEEQKTILRDLRIKSALR